MQRERWELLVQVRAGVRHSIAAYRDVLSVDPTCELPYAKATHSSNHGVPTDMFDLPHLLCAGGEAADKR